MGLSGSYKHKDIHSNNNKKISEKVLRGVKTYSTPFDISSLVWNADKDEK